MLKFQMKVSLIFFYFTATRKLFHFKLDWFFFVNWIQQQLLIHWFLFWDSSNKIFKNKPYHMSLKLNSHLIWKLSESIIITKIFRKWTKMIESIYFAYTVSIKNCLAHWQAFNDNRRLYLWLKYWRVWLLLRFRSRSRKLEFLEIKIFDSSPPKKFLQLIENETKDQFNMLYLLLKKLPSFLEHQLNLI
jgi:hypothetical protein